MSISSTVPYPTDLEAWWMDRIFRFYRTRDPKTAVKLQAPAAKKLSNLFTKERTESFGDYTNDEELILAYGIYAFPQTFARLSVIFQELTRLQAFPFRTKPDLRISDLGCGTGGATAALLHCLNQASSQSRVELTLFDQSTRHLELLSRLLMENRDQWPKDLRWITRHQTFSELVKAPVFQNKQHLILTSFALGEIFYGQPPELVTSWLDSLSGSLENNGLLLIVEPALQETSLRLMSVRDQLVAKGWQVVAPCPHAQLCPMLQEGKHWCHEVRTWKLPPNLQRLNEHLKHSLHELKFSFQALKPPGSDPQTRPPARMVAPLAKVKGRYVTKVCSANGHLEEWEIQTRTVEVEGRRHLNHFERGDWVEAKEKSPLTLPHRYRLPNPEAFSATF